jgi:hypothetical protein
MPLGVCRQVMIKKPVRKKKFFVENNLQSSATLVSGVAG